MRPHPRHRSLAALATGAALVAGVMVVPASAGAAPAPRAIPRATPTWTAHAQHLGKADAAGVARARVYLAPRGGFAALQAAALAVSTPGSATYHRFLSSAQYHAQYPPTRPTVARVAAWLRSSGLNVRKVEAHHRYIAVRGTVAQANKAFSTSIGRYIHNGRTVQAPAVAGEGTGRGRVRRPCRHRPGHHAAHGQAGLDPGGAAAGGFRNAPPVLALLRPDHREVPGRLPHPAADRSTASTCRTRRVATPARSTARRTRTTATWTARASPWRSPTRTPRRPSATTSSTLRDQPR